jgi:hypothetical protein
MQGMARRKLSPTRMPSNRYLGRQWSGLRCSKSSSSHFAAASQPGGSLRVLSRVLIEPRRGGRLTRSKKAAGIARCGSPGSKIVCLRKPTQPRSAQLRPHFTTRKSKYAVPMQEQRPCCCLATALADAGRLGLIDRWRFPEHSRQEKTGFIPVAGCGRAGARSQRPRAARSLEFPKAPAIGGPILSILSPCFGQTGLELWCAAGLRCDIGLELRKRQCNPR